LATFKDVANYICVVGVNAVKHASWRLLLHQLLWILKKIEGCCARVEEKVRNLV